jgi:predicted secreted protein
MSAWQNKSKAVTMKNLLFILLLLFQVGCASQNKTAGEGNKENSSGKISGLILLKNCPATAEVSLNDTLVVQFSEFPGRGYSWNLNSTESLQDILKPGDIKRYSLKDMDDAEEKADFYFLAIKKGTVLLKFTYSRPWEKNKPAADSCVTKINIQ